MPVDGSQQMSKAERLCSAAQRLFPMYTESTTSTQWSIKIFQEVYAPTMVDGTATGIYRGSGDA
jgi:hypothetical protein